MEKFLHMQKLLGFARRAIDDYGMISSGDRIAVGVSGGKDSLTLLAALRGLQKFYPAEFEIVPITLDMGFDGGDTCAPAELCRRLELEHTVVKTDIYRIVFEIRKCDSPCSLCAKLRRGALYDAALANGCSKVALGHHFDDAVETFMLNLFNEGRIGCFAPVTYLDRKKVTVIRPLLYMPEHFARRFVEDNNIAVAPKICPADGYTDRERIKQMLAKLEAEDHGLKSRLFGAMERAEVNGFATHMRSVRRSGSDVKDTGKYREADDTNES